MTSTTTPHAHTLTWELRPEQPPTAGRLLLLFLPLLSRRDFGGWAGRVGKEHQGAGCARMSVHVANQTITRVPGGWLLGPVEWRVLSGLPRKKIARRSSREKIVREKVGVSQVIYFPDAIATPDSRYSDTFLYVPTTSAIIRV